MKWVICLSVISIGCTSVSEKQIQVTEETSNEQGKPIVVKSKLDSMLDVISYVDSAQIVEKQVETVTKLKEENEKLEEAVVAAEKQIKEIKTELIETKKVVNSIVSDTNVTPFILLPI